MTARRIYKVNDVSRLTGVSIRTLHYYEEVGLLVPSRRTDAGYRLYTDEDVHAAVAAGLRRRGFDVLTTFQAGRVGTSDEAQLEFAATDGRVVFTFNRGDFAHLHSEFLRAGRTHAGIVVSVQAPPGPVVRAVAKLLASRSADDFVDQLFWLDISDPTE